MNHIDQCGTLRAAAARTHSNYRASIFPQIDIWSKTLCEWFEGINTPAEPIYFMCPSDAFMAGVRSTHDQTSDRT